MNSDLNVILTIFIDNVLQKVAIHIKDGLNKFPDYECFGEPDIIAKWKELLPYDLRNGVICNVETILYIINTVAKQDPLKEMFEYLTTIHGPDIDQDILEAFTNNMLTYIGKDFDIETLKHSGIVNIWISIFQDELKNNPDVLTKKYVINKLQSSLIVTA